MKQRTVPCFFRSGPRREFQGPRKHIERERRLDLLPAVDLNLEPCYPTEGREGGVLGGDSYGSHAAKRCVEPCFHPLLSLSDAGEGVVSNNAAVVAEHHHVCGKSRASLIGQKA